VDRTETLLQDMTLEERAALTAGSALWYTVPVPRLGIPRVKVSDGPAGVRGANPAFGRSASFPCGTALAATWNPELIGRVGEALAGDARGKGVHVLLGPTINIHRSPLAGRNFECYSEDPYLTARLAVAYIRGVQRHGVAATAKHFVCNDSEYERMSMSSDVGERALREIYLLPFEAAVREAGVWAVMAAYNRLHGTYCSEHPLLTTLLKGEWGFDGLVMSDWYGTHSTAPAANAGLDLEMPGPALHQGDSLLAAVRAGEVPEDVVAEKTRRLLRLAERTGALDQVEEPPEQSVDRPEHRHVARQAAAESIVLLENESAVLPLAPGKLRSLAVIGPNAEISVIQGGGSVRHNPHPNATPLEAIRAACPGVDVRFEAGCSIDKGTAPLDRRLLPQPLMLAYYTGTELSGEPVLTAEAPGARLTWIGEPAPGLDAGNFAVRGSGKLVPRTDGEHVFSLASAGRSRLLVDGALVVDNWDTWRRGSTFHGAGSDDVNGTLELVAGREYDLVVELSAGSGLVAGIMAGCAQPVAADAMERAVALAASSDAAIVVVGTNADWETEGADRTSMALPGRQVELIERVAAANGRTIVVVNAGAPVEMEWADHVPAVLQSWFGGEEAAPALADVLFGRVNPSGRLPTTIPRRLQDTPAFLDYPGENGHVAYGEGVFVGYRWYDSRDIEPRFCFGHGLSYSTFRIGPPEPERTELAVGDPLTVWVEVTNAGECGGFEVVQLYVRDVESRLARPDKELKAFAKVWVEPGATERVPLALDFRSFACWDPAEPGWVAEPGTFELLVGASSRDIRGSADVRLVPRS
jgi:beta-glucosidase